LFRAIFGVQYSQRDFGIRQCQGQPCQKHPSTNKAKRTREKTKSGLPGKSTHRLQPLIRWARKIAMSLSSVALFPRERIAAMICDRFDLETTSAIVGQGYSSDCDFCKAQRESAFIGGPIEKIRPDDVVWIEPGKKHWHGATTTMAITHIAIAEAFDCKVVDWME
jgi:hypothetical protein